MYGSRSSEGEGHLKLKVTGRSRSEYMSLKGSRLIWDIVTEHSQSMSSGLKKYLGVLHH